MPFTDQLYKSITDRCILISRGAIDSSLKISLDPEKVFVDIKCDQDKTDFLNALKKLDVYHTGPNGIDDLFAQGKIGAPDVSRQYFFWDESSDKFFLDGVRIHQGK
jgi:hypothetical protein